jgi:hypothetical protein
MITATELFNNSNEALVITGPVKWDSPDESGQCEVLHYEDEEDGEDAPFWCLTPPDSIDDCVPLDTAMAMELIASHLRNWLLNHGWQVQVSIRKDTQRWRLVDCFWFADGGGDRLDNDYPFGNEEFTVLYESVIVVAGEL